MILCHITLRDCVSWTEVDWFMIIITVSEHLIE